MNTAVCAAIFALGFVLAAVGGSMDSDGGTPNKASADVVDYETGNFFRFKNFSVRTGT